MLQLFGITVDVPALDRLMDYLEAKEQSQIDSLVAQLSELARRLAQSNTRLEAAKEK